MADSPSLPLSTALRQINNGDIGLMTPTTGTGNWIVRLGRSKFSHCCMFFKQRMRQATVVWLVEQINPEGREVPARSYLKACPSGCVTVYRPRWANRHRAVTAVEWMRANVPGVSYDHKGLWRSFWAHAPVVRWWLRPDDDDEANGNGRRPLYCSAAVARACRIGGGLDLVPGLSDSWTEPGDLAKSAALERLFTIVLPEGM